jgi:hypothetical protein
MRSWIAGLLLACTALPAQSFGNSLAQDPNTSAVFVSGLEKLKPGQFVWSPDLAPSGPMSIVVDLAAQRAHVYRNGVQIGFTTISSGRPGYETPTGVFTILQKARVHRSRKYDNAPMPYTLRLTWEGIALHGGVVHRHPASHGCIRLPMDFSRMLFDEARTGSTTVVITEGSPSAEAIAGQKPLSGSTDLQWQPDRSPTGPVTILVSLMNQQILIMRDGVMIGRSQVEIPKAVTSDPRALQIVATGQSGEMPRFHAGLPNHDAGSSEPANADQTMQVRVPPEFLAEVRSVETPGATALIVENSIIGAGMPLVVMAGG